jgi:hypothetical protein
MENYNDYWETPKYARDIAESISYDYDQLENIDPPEPP